MRLRVPFLVAMILTSANANASQQSDLIPTEHDATQLAQKICGGNDVSNPKGHWSARLQDGTWYAWFDVQGTSKDCPVISITIRATDGAIWTGKSFNTEHSLAGCNLCAY
jgi:hypothetical protein